MCTLDAGKDHVYPTYAVWLDGLAGPCIEVQVPRVIPARVQRQVKHKATCASVHMCLSQHRRHLPPAAATPLCTHLKPGTAICARMCPPLPGLHLSSAMLSYVNTAGAALLKLLQASVVSPALAAVSTNSRFRCSSLCSCTSVLCILSSHCTV